MPQPIGSRLEHPMTAFRNWNKIGVSPGYLLDRAYRDAHLDVVKDLGPKWVRVDANWAGTEPTTQGTFSWTLDDAQMAKVAALGLKPLVVFIISTPSWARGGAGSGATLPTDPFNMATFIKAYMARYPWVKHFEIGNEVNIQSNMSVPNVAAYGSPASTFPTGGAYAKLMRACYTEIKRQDPTAYVLSCGMAAGDTDATNNSDLELMAQFFADNGGSYADGFGAHTYNTTIRPGEVYTVGSTTSFQNWVPSGRIDGFAVGQGAQSGAASFIGTTPRTRATKAAASADSQFTSLLQLMHSHGHGHKKVWITEIGASTGVNASQITQAEQVEHVKRFFSIAQLDWTGPCFWYSAKDTGSDGVYENSFGLQTSAAVNKTAYATFKSLAAALPR